MLNCEIEHFSELKIPANLLSTNHNHSPIPEKIQSFLLTSNRHKKESPFPLVKDAFEKYNVTYDYLNFEHSGHAMLGDPEMQEKFIEMALDYCTRNFD